MNVRLVDGEQFQEVDSFRYLGPQVTVDGAYEKDVYIKILNEWYQAQGALKFMCRQYPVTSTE